MQMSMERGRVIQKGEVRTEKKIQKGGVSVKWKGLLNATG